MINEDKVRDVRNALIDTKLTWKMLCVLKALYDQPERQLTYEDLRIHAGYAGDSNLGIAAVFFASGLWKALEKVAGPKYGDGNEPFFSVNEPKKGEKSFQLTSEFRRVIDSSDAIKDVLSKRYHELSDDNFGSVTFNRSDFPDPDLDLEYELPTDQGFPKTHNYHGFSTLSTD